MVAMSFIEWYSVKNTAIVTSDRIQNEPFELAKCANTHKWTQENKKKKNRTDDLNWWKEKSKSEKYIYIKNWVLNIEAYCFTRSHIDSCCRLYVSIIVAFPQTWLIMITRTRLRVFVMFCGKNHYRLQFHLYSELIWLTVSNCQWLPKCKVHLTEEFGAHFIIVILSF